MRLQKRTFTCTSECTGTLITQPDLSRTIRQILRDTIEGKPSPVPLNSQKSVLKTCMSDKDMHGYHNVGDRLEQIDQYRRYTVETERIYRSNKSSLANAEREALREEIEKRTKEATSKAQAQPATNKE